MHEILEKKLFYDWIFSLKILKQKRSPKTDSPKTNLCRHILKCFPQNVTTEPAFIS